MAQHPIKRNHTSTPPAIPSAHISTHPNEGKLRSRLDEIQLAEKKISPRREGRRREAFASCGNDSGEPSSFAEASFASCPQLEDAAALFPPAAAIGKKPRPTEISFGSPSFESSPPVLVNRDSYPVTTSHPLASTIVSFERELATHAASSSLASHAASSSLATHAASSSLATHAASSSLATHAASSSLASHAASSSSFARPDFTWPTLSQQQQQQQPSAFRLPFSSLEKLSLDAPVALKPPTAPDWVHLFHENRSREPPVENYAPAFARDPYRETNRYTHLEPARETTAARSTGVLAEPPELKFTTLGSKPQAQQNRQLFSRTHSTLLAQNVSSVNPLRRNQLAIRGRSRQLLQRNNWCERVKHIRETAAGNNPYRALSMGSKLMMPANDAVSMVVSGKVITPEMTCDQAAWTPMIQCSVLATGEALYHKPTPLRAPSRKSVIPRNLGARNGGGFPRDELTRRRRNFDKEEAFAEEDLLNNNDDDEAGGATTTTNQCSSEMMSPNERREEEVVDAITQRPQEVKQQVSEPGASGSSHAAALLEEQLRLTPQRVSGSNVAWNADTSPTVPPISDASCFRKKRTWREAVTSSPTNNRNDNVAHLDESFVAATEIQEKKRRSSADDVTQNHDNSTARMQSACVQSACMQSADSFCSVAESPGGQRRLSIMSFGRDDTSLELTRLSFCEALKEKARRIFPVPSCAGGRCAYLWEILAREEGTVAVSLNEPMPVLYASQSPDGSWQLTLNALQFVGLLDRAISAEFESVVKQVEQAQVAALSVAAKERRRQEVQILKRFGQMVISRWMHQCYVSLLSSSKYREWRKSIEAILFKKANCDGRRNEVSLSTFVEMQEKRVERLNDAWRLGLEIIKRYNFAMPKEDKRGVATRSVSPKTLSPSATASFGTPKQHLSPKTQGNSTPLLIFNKIKSEYNPQKTPAKIQSFFPAQIPSEVKQGDVIIITEEQFLESHDYQPRRKTTTSFDDRRRRKIMMINNDDDDRVSEMCMERINEILSAVLMREKREQRRLRVQKTIFEASCVKRLYFKALLPAQVLETRRIIQKREERRKACHRFSLLEGLSPRGNAAEQSALQYDDENRENNNNRVICPNCGVSLPSGRKSFFSVNTKLPHSCLECGCCLDSDLSSLRKSIILTTSPFLNRRSRRSSILSLNLDDDCLNDDIENPDDHEGLGSFPAPKRRSVILSLAISRNSEAPICCDVNNNNSSNRSQGGWSSSASRQTKNNHRPSIITTTALGSKLAGLQPTHQRSGGSPSRRVLTHRQTIDVYNRIKTLH